MRPRRVGGLIVTLCASVLIGAWVAPGGVTAAPSGAPAASGAAYSPPQGEDLSSLTWVEAFSRLNAKFAAEYAFTQWRGIDWTGLYATYAPQVAAAQATGDRTAYYLALRAYAQDLRDGHVSITDDPSILQARAGGGFGLVATRLDSGAVVAAWIARNGPAARVGMKVGARLVAWDGLPIAQAVEQTSTVLAPMQPTNARRAYERLRFLTRAPVGATRTVTFVNPGTRAPRTVTLTAVDDGLETLRRTDSRSVIAMNGIPKRMVEWRILPGNVGYVRIKAEIDLPAEYPGDHTPTLTQFRSAIHEFIASGVEGVVVDIRSNSGGSDQMVADMLGSFSTETTFYEYQNYLVPGTGRFQVWVADDVTGEYTRRGQGIWITPAEEVYTGPLVALVDNGCISSGEGLAMGIRRLPNARVVGFTGTNGSFGMVGDGVLMPEGIQIGWPFGQSLGHDRVVQIDSHYGHGGVRPNARIPMTLRNAVRDAQGVDVELEYGLRTLRSL